MPSDLPSLLARLPGFPVLTGQRVRLRAPSAGDVTDVFALFSDPGVARYGSGAPMQARAQAEGRIDEMQDAFARRDMIHWLVADRRGDVAIGSCTLFRFDARHRRAEVGYALRSDRWGRGLAAEAVALALDWGFRTLALHRIEAGIDPRNDASRRLLERLGFRREDPPHEGFLAGDEADDSERYGLLAQAWREQAR